MGDEFVIYCIECGYPAVERSGIISCPNPHCKNAQTIQSLDRRWMQANGFIYGINFHGKKATCHVVVPTARIDDTSIRFTGKNYCVHCGKEVNEDEGTYCRKCDDGEEYELKYCHNCGSDRININRVFDTIHHECNYEYNCRVCGYYS